MRRVGRFGWLVALAMYSTIASLASATPIARAPAAAPTACGPEYAHCIRILFTYTQRGLAQLARAGEGRSPELQPCIDRVRRANRERAISAIRGYCMAELMARRNAASLQQAFRVSGVSPAVGVIGVVNPIERAAAVDAGETDRVDDGQGYANLSHFNSVLIHWLTGTSNADRTIDFRGRGSARIREWGGQYQIIVVFSGLVRAGGPCPVEAVASPRYAVLTVAGCSAGAGGPRAMPTAVKQELMFLHEVGHVFGADHDDNADCTEEDSRGYCRQPHTRDLQPCHPNSRTCAWQACVVRTRQGLRQTACQPAQLATTRDAFCTLVGQWNVSQRHCISHRQGWRGTGWIREFSHPGRCNTEGYEQIDCGDQRHNATAAINANVATIASARAGQCRDLPSDLRDFPNRRTCAARRGESP